MVRASLPGIAKRYGQNLFSGDHRFCGRSPWQFTIQRLLESLEGPAVESLGVTFLEDWELETSEGIDQLRETGDHLWRPAGTDSYEPLRSDPRMVLFSGE